MFGIICYIYLYTGIYKVQLLDIRLKHYLFVFEAFYLCTVTFRFAGKCRECKKAEI